jgi:glycosyltransferase involved in cell wall biosynthesis
MRILFLCYRGNPFCGGQGIYLYHLTKELAKLGAEIDVIVGPPYPEPLDEWARVFRLDNLNLWAERTRKLPYEKLARVLSPWHFTDYFLTRFHIFPEMETFSMRAFFLVKDLLRERRYDIVHDVQCLGWGLLPMKEYGMPIVTTVHHPLTHDRRADFMIDRNMWEKFCTIMFYPLSMQRAVINRLDRVITSSQSGVSDLGAEYGVRPEKVSVVYNGMDVEGFRNTGEPREKRTLLFVGNTEDHKKGMRYLFEALALLPEDVTLTIVDEGPPRRLSAWNIITEKGLQDRVRFTGKVSLSDLASLYSRATVLVMASLHEGFGLPAAEAMACGTPVIATTAGALPEVVGDEGAGILVPPRDGKALADAVMKVLADARLRRSMGEKGRRRAEENFAWPVAARNTMAVYRDVIESYRRAV